MAAKLRKDHDMPCLQLNTCVAHSYALVGKQSGQYMDGKLSYITEKIYLLDLIIDDGQMRVRPFIANFESLIGKIYSYFHRSPSRQYKSKQWYNFLTMPELKFKKIFEIRWLSIRNCLKPIINNMKPGKKFFYALKAQVCDSYKIILGNQALPALLEHTSNDLDLSQYERDTAAELLREILDDRFLFVLHFHFDLHECISGELALLFCVVWVLTIIIFP